jgi:hypothetical protein
MRNLKGWGGGRGPKILNYILLRSISWFNYTLLWVIIWLVAIRWSSNSWIFIWLMMELLFIIFLGKNVPRMFYRFDYRGLLIKYYLNQVVYSLIFLFGVLFGFLMLESCSSILIMLALISKLGFFPFHLWIISLVGKMDWLNYFLLISIIKLIPFLLYFYVLSSFW